MLLEIVIAVYIVMSLVTAAVYWHDKRAARAGLWRVRESTLQWLALLGGWPGALVAQGLFRHKRRKFGFMAVFALICGLHVTAWGWIILGRG